ncbi:putative geranylgeranyl pyrophosphate synthase, chloroplastic-like [Capsicum annuum]|nr:putative geranylgeranyl pyrophosphate synthase, chloroplastic-like [Capsicum annuum]
MVVEAYQLFLPKPPFFSPSFPSPPPHFSSFLFHPSSFSLALFHSDSSISLYSPFSLSSFPPPLTTLPPPISAASFLLLRNPNPTTLFLITSPVSGGASVLLRFYILNSARKSFAPARVVCNQSDLEFDESKFGMVFRVSHGVSVKLVGDVNVFALYSISNGKVWVFAVKQLGGEEVKLMKCAVIDCSLPVFSISVSFGFLILGEDNGVRVFPLRPLVKGRVKKEKGVITKSLNSDKMEIKRLPLRNGMMIHGMNGVNAEICSADGGKLMCIETDQKLTSNVVLDERIENRAVSAKLRSVRLRQDSREGIANFMAFKNKDDNFESIKIPAKSAKAIGIQALSSTKFLILDSEGNLHLLFLATSVGSGTPYHMKQLTHNMKVRKLAVLPDSSTRSQTVWISDSLHTLHMIAVTDMDASVNQTDRKDPAEMLVQTSVAQAIFSNEKVQEIEALSANTVLLLGQGSMFAYAIS